MNFVYSTNEIIHVSIERSNGKLLGYLYFLPDARIKEDILNTTFEDSYQHISLDHDMWIERITPDTADLNQRRVLKITFIMSKLDSVEFLYEKAFLARSTVIGFLNERHDKYNDTFKMFNYFKTKASAAK